MPCEDTFGRQRPSEKSTGNGERSSMNRKRVSAIGISILATLGLAVLGSCEINELGREADLEIISIPATQAPLLGLDFSGGEGWAVGSAFDGLEAACFFNPSQDGNWNELNGPEGDLRAVAGDGAGGCLVVGDEGLIYSYDGAVWTRHPNQTTDDLVDLDKRNGVAWAVGRNGAVLRYAGGDWTTLDPGTTAHLNAVVALDDGCLAAGDEGVVLRYSGGSWNQLDCGTTADFNDLVRLEDDHLLLVGPAGLILEYDAGVVEELDSPTAETINAVDATSPTYFIAVGSDGEVVLGEGGNLRRLESPTTENLYDIHLAGLNNAWIVGDHGTVLRYE